MGQKQSGYSSGGVDKSLDTQLHKAGECSFFFFLQAVCSVALWESDVDEAAVYEHLL